MDILVLLFCYNNSKPNFHNSFDGGNLIIIFDNRKFIETKFLDEQEIEGLVKDYSEHFFGPSSIFIPKARIWTHNGFVTIPDGFAVE